MDNNYNGNYSQDGYNPNVGYVQNAGFNTGYNTAYNGGYNYNNNYNYNQSNYSRNTTGNYMGDEYRPIRAIGYVGYMWLFLIPIIGWICLIVFACSNKNINRRNFARSYFINLLIGAIIGVIVAGVMIFGWGETIFNLANGVVGESTEAIDSVATSAFNSQFEVLFGENKTRSQVMNLIDKVVENNSSEYNTKITITGDRTSIDQVKEDSSAQRYIISASGYDKNGFLNKISITI